jgi:hypothetical protein
MSPPAFNEPPRVGKRLLPLPAAEVTARMPAELPDDPIGGIRPPGLLGCGRLRMNKTHIISHSGGWLAMLSPAFFAYFAFFAGQCT